MTCQDSWRLQCSTMHLCSLVLAMAATLHYLGILELSTLAHLMQDAEAALKVLADSRPPGDIGKQAYHLYERFRPTVQSGTGGWGQKAELRLDKIRDMATEKQ